MYIYYPYMYILYMWCVYIVFFWFCMFDIIYILSYLSMYIFEIYLRSRWPNRITNFPVGQASPSSLLRTAYGGGRAVLLGAVLFRSLPFVVYSGRRVRRWLKNGAGFLASRFYWCYLVYDSINIFHYIYICGTLKWSKTYHISTLTFKKLSLPKSHNFFSRPQVAYQFLQELWHRCRGITRHSSGAWTGACGSVAWLPAWLAAWWCLGWHCRGMGGEKRWKMRRQTDIMWVKQWRTIPWITINS